MEELKTYEEVWEEIEKDLNKTGMNLFQIKIVYLPSSYFEIYKVHCEQTNLPLSWCGLKVVKFSGDVIYFGLR